MKRLLKILVPLTLFLVTLAGLYLAVSPAPKVTFEHIFIYPGDKKRFPAYHEYAQFPPLSKVRQIARLGNFKLFDVIYTMNRYSLREEPGRRGTEEKHLILAGCSFTYGIGVSDAETLSSLLRKAYPGTDVVNFGQGGGGLHTLLRSQELLPIREIIPSSRGLFVYVFIHDHLIRWTNDPANMPNMGPNYPHYFLKNGKLEQIYVKDSPAYQTWLASGRKLPPAVSNKVWPEETLRSFVAGVKLLRQRYLETYPEGKFMFLFHPFGEGFSNKNLKILLDEANIEYASFEKEFVELTDAKPFDPGLGDGHPSAEFNEWLAALLREKINL